MRFNALHVLAVVAVFGLTADTPVAVAQAPLPTLRGSHDVTKELYRRFLGADCKVDCKWMRDNADLIEPTFAAALCEALSADEPLQFARVLSGGMMTIRSFRLARDDGPLGDCAIERVTVQDGRRSAAVLLRICYSTASGEWKLVNLSHRGRWLVAFP